MSSEVITLENLSTFKGKCDETYQSKLTAGENITISEDNVISATGGGESNVAQFTRESSIDDINAAIDAGKVVCIIDAERVYWFDRRNDDGKYLYFYSADTYSGFLYSLSYQGTYWSRSQTVVQKKLTAGENITIQNNVISATVPDISDMETKTHAAATYQPKGDYALNGSSYTKNESDEKYAEKLDDIPVIAGTNVSLEVNDEGKLVISATGGDTSDLVFFDYESGNPEITWDEIKSYMDIGRQVIIYDKTVTTDGKTKFGYVSNYDKANNFIQFTNVSNFSISGTNYTGVNWAYLGNNLGWQRTLAQSGGMSTVHTAEPIIGDGSEANPVTANTLDVDYQQITHDDSLVHVSNNSQYALGVNIPVVANECIKFINGLTNLNTTGTAGANKGRVCHLNVTIPEGYKFGMWSQLATKSWVGSVYPEHPYLNDVDVWCPYAGTAFSTSHSIEWCCMVIKDGGN